MLKLPIVSGDNCIKVLEKCGYIKDHQKGSHMIMVKSGRIPITVPRHYELDAGLLRSIIRDTGLSVRQFTALLKK